MPTFSGPKSDFIRSTEQALTGQDAIAIGISVEQRYLAIVAGKQADLNAEQIEQARQAFAKAYGGNAGPMAIIRALPSPLSSRYKPVWEMMVFATRFQAQVVCWAIRSPGSCSWHLSGELSLSSVASLGNGTG